jgi:1,5-anhydro-D-fructose reductase (1,5-anhydro-D-mannitol-forming)
LKWALIGASDIAATRVIPALRLADQEVYGVMSSNESHAISYASANDIPRWTMSLTTLLEWPVDAVYISTTNVLHSSQAIAAAKAKKHILCEKPIALNLEQALEMVSQANENNVTLATNHHIRSSGVHQKIREIVRSGDLGDIYLVRINHAVQLPERLRGWRLTANEEGAGVVWDIAVHNIDTLRAALDSEISEVMALTATRGLARSGVEDLSVCTFRFENDVIASTSESFLVPFSTTSMEIHGSHATLVASGVMRQDPVGDITLTNASGVHEIPVDDRENLYVKTIRRFEGACHGDGEPICAGADGVASVKGVLAALKSARESRTVLMSEFDD